MSDINRGIQAYQAKDYATALTIFTQLAEQGQPHARYLLGTMTSFGEGCPSNPAEAARHYRIAADAGHTVAQYCLGALYAQGRGVPQDYAEAMRWYRKAAEAGEPDALFKVGVMYANSQGVPLDLAEAGRWWEKAAAKGHAGAMLFLGHLHGQGDIGAANAAIAAGWYLKSWDAGNEEAVAHLVQLQPALEQAADEGSAVAQNALGIIHKFVRNNAVEAVRRLTQAAEQNHPEALRLLAYSYQHGEGIDQDQSRAATVYQKAAELGDKIAQYNLGIAYRDGMGDLQPDIDQAIRWFRRAANQGMSNALQPLAEALAFRNRDRRDANEAVQRLLMVASAGPEDAEYHLVAGNGEWSVSMQQRGTITALRGLTMDELQGLPDQDD